MTPIGTYRGIAIELDGRVFVDGTPEDRSEVARYLASVRTDPRYDLFRTV